MVFGSCLFAANCSKSSDRYIVSSIVYCLFSDSVFVQMMMLRHTFNGDVEVQLGDSSDVLCDHEVLAGVAQLDSRHGKRRSAVGRLQVDMTGPRREMDTAARPSDLWRRRTAEPSLEYQRRAALDFTSSAVCVHIFHLRTFCIAFTSTWRQK